MISHQRQLEITEWICREGKATIAELAEHFGVSGETVRRDLSAIAKGGRIRKVHGGAIALRDPIRDESYAVRQAQNQYSKQQIGALAARLLSDNSVIGIDSGTCAESFARAIYNVKNLKIITHSLPVAMILAEKLTRGDFTGSVSILGGTVTPETGTVGGMVALSQISPYRMDQAFVAVTAVSDEGLMATCEQDGLLSAALIRQSNRAYLLAESDKMDKQSLYRFADFQSIRGIITDDQHDLSPALHQAITENGVELHVAQVRAKTGAPQEGEEA